MYDKEGNNQWMLLLIMNYFIGIGVRKLQAKVRCKHSKQLPYRVHLWKYHLEFIVQNTFYMRILHIFSTALWRSLPLNDLAGSNYVPLQ